MGTGTGWTRIETDGFGRETIVHGTPDYPISFYLEDVYAFELHRMDWHWHPEPELVYIESGSVLCRAGDTQERLTEGSAMLINGGILHSFEAEAPMQMPNLVFSPQLLAPEDSLIYRRHVQPFLIGGPACVTLRPEIAWQAEAIHPVRALLAGDEGERPEPLKTLRLLLELWQRLLDEVPLREDGDGQHPDINGTRLRSMLDCIQRRYRESLTLEEIAGSAYISSSSALQLFRSRLGISPVAYLGQYRLKQAARLLRSTRMDVTAIAGETGFQSSGYLCRRFRELYGMSPIEYRRSKAAEK